jgi:YVTN family beta-propeller protein
MYRNEILNSTSWSISLSGSCLAFVLSIFLLSSFSSFPLQNSDLTVLAFKPSASTANQSTTHTPATVIATVGRYPFGISVNPSTDMAYVANSDSNTVSVIDGKTNTVISNITVGRSPVAISANPSTNIAYVANADSNTVFVIDGKTNTSVHSFTPIQAPSTTN